MYIRSERDDPLDGLELARTLYRLPEHLRRRRKHEPEGLGNRFSERSPGRCRDSERPGLAAYAAAHELGYRQADEARDLIAGLLHGIQEARRGVGGCRP